MPSRTFALVKGGPKQLTVSWNYGWKNLVAQLDGKPLLTIPTSKELKAGREVQVGDGQILNVQLKQEFFGTALSLSINGRPLPGSGNDPQTRLASAYGVIYFVGCLSILLGILTEVFSVQFLRAIGAGWESVLEGLVFLALALWVHKRQSLVALALAVGLYALDLIVGIAAMASQPGTTPPAGGLVIKILFLVFMSRGFGAIKELRREKEASTIPSGTGPTAR